MLRRIHTPALLEGENLLGPAQAHHARAVLRLNDGDEVELFDDEGGSATGVLRFDGPHGAAVRVERLAAKAVNATRQQWSVASAVPKGERADWMVEKLSELGARAFIPLATARSVVHPEGRNKHDRWVRIATESAKQSRRPGVMRIDALTPLAQAVNAVAAGSAPGQSAGWCLSTGDPATPIASAFAGHACPSLTLFIGPEGGWTPDELARMTAAGFLQVRLTHTVLRVETAALAAGAIVAALSDRLA